jgi:alkanesulfonate monooxygenase SsuD/methylene tetrahydromethanopterin reductase-like flavin-dependent oxidoreductase (luciferase family)
MLPSVADPDTGKADPRRAIRAALLAEQSGFDGVYVGDHLLHPYPILESLVSLAAVAANTQRVIVGPCVLLVALREPLFLAKQLGTLDALAPGRLRVGVGVGGEYPGEFVTAGVPLSQRGTRTDLALNTLRKLMSEGVRSEGAVMQPLAPDVPFFVGGHSDRAIARAATTQGWIGYLLSPDSFARRHAKLKNLNQDPHFATGMLLPCHVEDSSDAARSASRAWSRMTDSRDMIPERFFMAGSPERIAERLQQYWELGCGEFIVGVAEQGSRYLDQVSQFAEEVLPLVRKFR